MEIPEFNTKRELFDFLHKNQSTIIASKKAQITKSDPFEYYPTITIERKVIANKEDQSLEVNNPDKLVATVIINTTNFLDSHNDLHLPGIWNKSVSENKMIMHLQEHEMSFENIISDGQDLKVSVKRISWIELGFNFPGMTEALIFESTIRKDRNEFMLQQYRKGFVKNHSVGMIYVKMVLCINDDSYGAEYEAWQKYYPEIVNKELADERGFFWAIKEAKVIEGSAVPLGSNTATPTLSTKEKDQPDNSTDTKINQPSIDTEKAIKIIQESFKKLKI